jgi:hypothetical protein
MRILVVDDRCLQQFVAMHGTQILVHFISHISHKGKQRFVIPAYRLFAVRSTIVKDGSRPSARIRDSSLYKVYTEFLGMSWGVLPRIA